MKLQTQPRISGHGTEIVIEWQVRDARDMILYKYVVPDRTDILEREFVRFTHPRALNDLSELRPAFARLFRPEEVQQHLHENPLDRAEIARGAYADSPEHVRQLFGEEGFRQFTVDALASREGAAVMTVFQHLALER